MIGPSPHEPDYSEFIEVDPTGRYGRYNEILGKGSSKTVYRAFDEYEGIEVAWNQVKLYDFLQSPQDLERLYCEIHLLKTLKHKNIMKFYTSWVDTANRNINFVTEMFTSGTLRQYRQRHKRVNIRAVKHWCRQILRGLLYLHSHDPPVIHRDLKCDNIFINGNQGEVKIGDLGLAAILRKSHAAHCVGTPEFMAPEVYEEEYNELVDIYSFGMCILEMVTFDYPYSECTHPAQIYKKVISGKKPDALYKVEDPELREFVEKCLVTVSQRLPARELLTDPFLQMDNCCPDSELIGWRGDIDEIGPIWRQPVNVSSLINGYSSHLSYGSENGRDYDVDGMEPHGIEFFQNQDDEHSGNVGITIKGKMRDDEGIFLRLRIADIEGHVRNIYFPFDVETDTALNVATEMVAELDITDQDVTKIALMIDNEISSLMPDWKPGPGAEEEAPASSRVGFCHHCTSNSSSHGSVLGILSATNPNSNNLQGPHCSHLGCASMHGRFEEFTYQVEGDRQCTIEVPPVLSTQSGRVHPMDISPRCEAHGMKLGQSGQTANPDEKREEDQPTSANEETIKHMIDQTESKARAVNQLSRSNLSFAESTNCSSAYSPSSSYGTSNDYDEEIRQELRWLKAKYQMELRDLRNQKFGGSQKSSQAMNHRKKRAENGLRSSSIWPPSQEENDDMLLKSFASGKHFSSDFPAHDTINSASTTNSSPSVENQRSQHCEAAKECSPDYMFTAKNFYVGALLPQSIHRTKSLPVDAVDV